MYRRLSAREEMLAGEVVDIAVNIHKKLGPGLLESVYEKCFCYELNKRNIPFQRQCVVPVVYESLVIAEGYRVDIMVEDVIILELKAQEVTHPVWEAQILSYLRLSGKRLGFLLNFHVPLMKDGIKRIIL